MAESESWVDFLSESEDDIDRVLNEQDEIIDDLRREVKQLDEFSDYLVEEQAELKSYVKKHIIRCSNILRKLVQNNATDIEEFTISKQIVRGEVVCALRILNDIISKVK